MTGAGGTLLVINAGSSSIKFQLFDVTPPDGLRLAFRGQLEGIGSKPHLSDATGAILTAGRGSGRGRCTGPDRCVAPRPAR